MEASSVIPMVIFQYDMFMQTEGYKVLLTLMKHKPFNVVSGVVLNRPFHNKQWNVLTQ